MEGLPSDTIVADFWSPNVQTSPHSKFLGLRLYYVDAQWTFRLLLLCVKEPNLTYRQRRDGIRAPFKRWILSVLSDFDLSREDLYAATTEVGPYVKHMLKDEFQLEWEWCLWHLSNVYPNMACELVSNVQRSKTPPWQRSLHTSVTPSIA